MNLVLSPTHEASTRIIRHWLSDLAQLTTAGSQKITSRRLTTMADVLAREIPSAAFTRDSLDAIRSGMHFFPDVEEIRKRVLQHWNVNKPKIAPAIGTQPVGTAFARKIQEILNPTLALARIQDERYQIQDDWMDRNNVKAAVRSLDGHPMQLHLGRMLAGAVARHAPANLDLIPQDWIGPELSS